MTMKSLHKNAVWTSSMYTQGTLEDNWSDYQIEVTMERENNPYYDPNRSNSSIIVLDYLDEYVIVEDDVGNLHKIDTSNTDSMIIVPPETYLNANCVSLESSGTSMGLTYAYGMQWSDDGRKMMFFRGSTSDLFGNHARTIPYDVSTLASAYYSTGNPSNTTEARSFSVSKDGTKVYASDTLGYESIAQYTLPTPWQFETATHTYDGIVNLTSLFGISYIAVYGMHWDDDGSHFYLMSRSDGRDLYKFSCSTPWDVLSTLTLVDQIDIAAILSTGNMHDGIYVSDTKMDILLTNNSTIVHMVSDTPWDSGTTLNANNITIGSILTPPSSFLTFGAEEIHISRKNNALVVREVGSSSTANVYSYGITQNFLHSWGVDISSLGLSSAPIASKVLRRPSVDAKVALVSNPDTIYLGADSSSKILYVANTSNNEYLSVDYNNDNEVLFENGGTVTGVGMLQSSTIIQRFDCTQPQYFGSKFSVDGHYFAIGTYQSDKVALIYLDTPWDINTWSLVGEYTTAGTTTDAYIHPEGTSLYYINYDNDTVYQVPLSTPFDLTTGGTPSTKGITTQEATPYGLKFSPDGVYMFISGQSNEINRYTLSTPWDVTTATADKVEPTTGFTGVSGMDMTNDGKYLVICGTSTLVLYNLTTPWDINTMEYVEQFDPSELASLYTVMISDDLSKIYLGNGDDNMYIYDMTETKSISSCNTVANTTFIETTSPFTSLPIAISKPINSVNNMTPSFDTFSKDTTLLVGLTDIYTVTGQDKRYIKVELKGRENSDLEISNLQVNLWTANT